MKGLTKLLVLFICCVGILAMGTLHAQAAPKKCCIAGTYDGTRADDPDPVSCPRPERGKFIFNINQDKNCGSRIWGKVLNQADKSTMNFEGSVASVSGKCCKIKGKVTKVGDPTDWAMIQGTLCKVRGKWVCTDGTYSSLGPGSSGCKGKFRMEQR